MDQTAVHVLSVSLFCFVLIAFRCGYRLLSRCNIHIDCHRKWHQDDLWMAIAVVPLIARAIAITFWGNLHGPGHTDSELARAQKLLIVARLGYAIFLWCLKMTIGTFYVRLTDRANYMRKSGKILHWFIFLTFLAVFLSTLLECRPLNLFWHIDHTNPPSCQKGTANLLTMAVTNIVTDILLILFPIPLLWRMTLSKAKKIQLTIVFSVGIFVIAVTSARLPLIFDQSNRQVTRSIWASIEMGTACLVANVGFFYALIKDVMNGHSNSGAAARASVSTAVRPGSDLFENRTSRGSWASGKGDAVHLEKIDV